MKLTKYSLGQHRIEMFPAGEHAVVRRSAGLHAIEHPASWYVQRSSQRAMKPAFAVLLSSAMSATTLGLPVSALAMTPDELEAQESALGVTYLRGEDGQIVLDADGNPIIVGSSEESSDSDDQASDEDTAQDDSSETTGQDGSAGQTPADGQESGSGTETQDGDSDVKPDAGGGVSGGGKSGGKDATAKDGEAGASDVDKNAAEKEAAEKEAAEKETAEKEAAEKAAAEQAAAEQAAAEQLAAQQAAAEQEVQQNEPAHDASPEAATATYATVDDGTTLDATMTELKVASRLLDAGWTPEMIAAAIGNMYAESGSNAASFCNMSGMFNYGYEIAGGLFQWTDCGSSAGSLSSAGFSGLVQYAELQGKDWRDATLQTEYFLSTWRDSWMDRQSYYDASSPEFAGVDVSIDAFDESDKTDFDGDGIIDSRDDDIDGDGLINSIDPINEIIVNGTTARYTENSVLKQAVKASAPSTTQRTNTEARQHVANLTFAFMAGYEGPSASVSHLDRRVAHALRMYPAIQALKEAHNLDIGANAALVVASAEAMLGGTYIWGAESPSSKTFDCSGLTKWCYSLVGAGIDHYSETQYAQADKVYSIAEATPGDILWKPGHVGIFIGNGMTVEAKGKDFGIVYGSASSFDAALHFNVLDERNVEQEKWENARHKIQAETLRIPRALQTATMQTLS